MPFLLSAARPPRVAAVGLRVGALAALVLAGATVAPAASAEPTARQAPPMSAEAEGYTPFGMKPPPSFAPLQHGPSSGHLPRARENMELVGKLNLVHPETQEPVLRDQVADVAVHKGYAYLNSWDSPTCEGGGTFVVDIRDPARPRQVAFIPSRDPYYHGEGAQVLSIDTPQFKGDLLAVNNETYGTNFNPRPACTPRAPNGDLILGNGGFDLYDVTDPAHPVTLVQAAGDSSPESSEVQDPALDGHAYHSLFAWQDGPRAYLVGADNTELSNVDIFDITDPRDPEFIKDLNPLELPEADQIVGEAAYGNWIYHHDVVVKRIAGQMRMLVSFWDAGYLQLNVDNPANPTYITDTNFDDPDPLTGFDPPEGNAHQAEYSHDNQFFLAADEDFDTHRAINTITEAPFAGTQFDAALSEAEEITSIPITGDTVFVGLGCAGTVDPPPAGVTIAVAERGVCSFQEKADAIEDAGYELGLVFNNDFGVDGNRCETLINMSITPDSVAIPMLFVPRAAGLQILGVYDDATYQCSGEVEPTPGDTQAPDPGTAGLSVELFDLVYDGWGYAHLYDANTSEQIDAWAIPEALDERYATGFGDLTIHEFATDPSTNLAYASHYSGGLRALRFSREGGLEEVGKFIDEGGNNFWGVEQFTDKDGNRLIAGSDRDYGLYIVKYTGPGAVLAKPAQAAPTATPPAVTPSGPASVRARKPSSFFGFGSITRLMISKGAVSVTISLPGPGKVVGTLKGGIGRTTMTLAKTTKTANAKGRLRLTFRVSAAKARMLRRTLARRSTRRTAGVLQVTYTPTGGTKRTRNKSLSIGMR